ncbi:MAG: inorganic diphosphatase [Rhodocyclaceae bacterium]|nr:inorganic diphosphatase [Rhodocyclaceae bacterium]
MVEVAIEIPRWSFLKRGSSGAIDFVSPLPCPFNYGAVPGLLGLEGDLLDALVLGPRLPLGSRHRVPAWGAIILVDRGMMDHKLVCSAEPPSATQLQAVQRFFAFYALAKSLLNRFRGQTGRHACDGWCTAESALALARPKPGDWRGPGIRF